MFWDKIAGLYDLFENIYNKSVFQETGKTVAKYISRSDEVLECACGTGAISIYIAEVCKKLFASDFSEGMLKQAKKKLRNFNNVEFGKVDITAIDVADNSYDVVVAGNVIHLLPEPQKAMKELERVCKNGGKLIIPTYINGDAGTNKLAVKFLEKLGANFKRQFDAKTYEKFFADMGYEKVSYEIVRGRMSCDVAVIEVKKVMKKKLPPVLETERLILRPLTLADKNEIFKWTGDPRVAKFMLYPTYKSPDDADFWLENIYKNDGELDYGFVWKETGELIGSGGLNYDEKSGNWKLGYNMRFDMWGKGIATEVSRKVIEYAREKYKGNKIIGCFALENPASRHVMEKLGMKFLRECEYSKFDGSETFKAQDWEMDF